jgi:hypothetical protein
MAQGQIKKPSNASAPSKGKAKTNGQSSSGITKKGALNFNPKKAKLQRQAKMNKKLTSGLTAQTERMLGERAGHLELIGKGRAKDGKNSGKDVKSGKKK